MWHVLRNFNNGAACMYDTLHNMAAGNSHELASKDRTYTSSPSADVPCTPRMPPSHSAGVSDPTRRTKTRKTAGSGQGCNREKIELRSSGKRTKLRAAKGIQPSRLLLPVSVVLRVIWSLSGLFPKKFLRSQSTFVLVYTARSFPG